MSLIPAFEAVESPKNDEKHRNPNDFGVFWAIYQLKFMTVPF